jgi:ribosomal protein S18 acetylase RimI-like enzyme
MSSITLPAKTDDPPQVRSLNILRDLPRVADLIELCFSATIDGEGQRYLSDMRRAGRDDKLSRWATHMAETTSLPLTGYVWEENDHILGNASLIPFRDKGQRIYLIANVATHPDQRRRGIARILTQRAMQHARAKRATAIWLHVRDDNPGAIQLYQDLGFHEFARRTAWQATSDPHLLKPYSDLQIVPRHSRFWPQQEDWLRRLYPATLDWYQPLNLRVFQPSLWNWLYLLFTDYEVRHWAALRGDELLATLTWLPHGGRSDSLYAAASPSANSAEALTQLLVHVRRSVSYHTTLSLDFPAGTMTEAIQAAGFKPRRTLIWMKA